mmetsp:Transcript_13961/g.41924  ORF Transcript_13961/g.41924 Transcript_13961/m.41924 type:complete len:295 (+) Transcript_13961:223-1107(+)
MRRLLPGDVVRCESRPVPNQTLKTIGRQGANGHRGEASWPIQGIDWAWDRGPLIFTGPANVNHGACRASHPPDADAVLRLAEPKAWRFWNGTKAIESSRSDIADIHHQPTCVRPRDWNASSVLCVRPEKDCRDATCTHCYDARYVIPQTRTHACLRDVAAEETRRGRPYRYVASFRPDYVMPPLPPFPLWPTFLGNERVYVCAAGDEDGSRFAKDYFFLLDRRLLPVFLTVLGTFQECQSRAANVRLGLPDADRWPWWFASEGIVYKAFAKHRVGVGEAWGAEGCGALERGGCR